jgi:hypothetical protein
VDIVVDTVVVMIYEAFHGAISPADGDFRAWSMKKEACKELNEAMNECGSRLYIGRGRDILCSSRLEAAIPFLVLPLLHLLSENLDYFVMREASPI